LGIGGSQLKNCRKKGVHLQGDYDFQGFSRKVARQLSERLCGISFPSPPHPVNITYSEV